MKACWKKFDAFRCAKRLKKMNKKNIKIKVIKKNLIKAREIKTGKKKDSKKDLQRKMVSNVSDWVDEFQKRRAEEVTQAFRQL